MSAKKPRLVRTPIAFNQRYELREVVGHKRTRPTAASIKTAKPVIAKAKRMQPEREENVSSNKATNPSPTEKQPGFFARLFGRPPQAVPTSTAAERIAEAQARADATIAAHANLEPIIAASAIVPTTLSEAHGSQSDNALAPEDDLSFLEAAFTARPTNEPVVVASPVIASRPPEPQSFATLDAHDEFSHLPVISAHESTPPAAHEAHVTADVVAPPAAPVNELPPLVEATIQESAAEPALSDIAPTIDRAGELEAVDVPALTVVDEPEESDDSLGGFAAFFSPLTEDEARAAEAHALVSQPQEEKATAVHDATIAWTMGLGLENAPTDPDARVKLVYLAQDLNLLDVLQLAATEDPHPSVRATAAAMLEELRAA